MRALILCLLIVAVICTEVDQPRSHAHKNVVRLNLQKHEAPEDERAKVLLRVKLRQTSPSFLETGSIPLEEEVLREKHLATYYGTVSVGETQFRVLFDTGSCEFWVPSSACRTMRCRRHRRFPADSLDNKRLLAGQMDIEYLSGKVKGELVHERVTIGDVIVPDQVVGVADTVDIVLLDDVVWDGIIGLAYPNRELSRAGVTPLFDTIIAGGVLSKQGLANQFAYYIDDHKGVMTFGGVDCDLFSTGIAEENCIKKFQFVPITKRAYWTITLKDVRIHHPGHPVQSGNCPREGCEAIVDTGTYLIYYPGHRGNIVRSFGNTCGHLDMLPTFHFDFATGPGEAPVTLTLRPVDYVLKFRVHGASDCVVGISPDHDTIWTLGQVFLRSFYTLFDRDANRVGFARLPRQELSTVG